MKNTKFYSIRTVVSGLLALLAFVSLCYGQSKSEQLNDLLKMYNEYGKFNGSALVAHNGEVVYKSGIGLANMEWDIPNATDTKHRLGSITKQFTAMLVLQLAAEGKLDLHAPITKYLPDYPNDHQPPISTHHLLTHTSGIPNYTAFPGFFREESRDPYSPKEFIEKFADKNLNFAPGSQFNYSNSGYFLLGVILEEVSGKSYEQLLQERILDPLGMKGSGFDHHETILKNRATGYEKNGYGFVNSQYLDMSIPYAAGSMYSTVEDLYLWDQALYTNKLLPAKYMDLYFEPQVPSFGHMHYAYGWGVGKDAIGNSQDSIVVISHGGGINGFSTIISRSPADKSLVVLLNNTGGAPLDQMARSIRGILYDKPYDPPKKSVADEVLGVIQSEGLEKGIARYKQIKDEETYKLLENEMNQVGYQIMASGQVEQASEVFKLNMEAFPKSFNVYDSYAEALMNLGQKEKAIAYYKKSLEINPGNQNGIDMLEKMGVDTSEYTEEITVPGEVMNSYLGKYELRPGFVLTITGEGSQMKAQATGQPMFDIFPKSENVFFLKVVEAQITFNKGADGSIESLTLLQGGQEITGKRLP